jgi:phosphoribosylanthranilate isomerase
MNILDLNEKSKRKIKLTELKEIIQNATTDNQTSCFLNSTGEQIWTDIAGSLAKELLQIHSLEPSVEKMREILNKIYIARNITMSTECVIGALEEIDKLFRDPNSYN